jgi:hypothetical protein
MHVRRLSTISTIYRADSRDNPNTKQSLSENKRDAAPFEKKAPSADWANRLHGDLDRWVASLATVAGGVYLGEFGSQ